MRNDGEQHRDKCGSCVNLKIHQPISGGYKCVRMTGIWHIKENKCSEWRYDFDKTRDYDEVDRLARRER